MHDLLIKGGTVIDGTGTSAYTADVAIVDGKISEVGRITSAAREKIDADGLLVTPGWVDIHTHYDGQATWDQLITPSFWHGVTTVVMGNCGVGFAPAAPDKHDWLIGLMEGVEDIPNAALSEGISWGWESFPEYLDALDQVPHAIDVGSQIAHGPIRAYVMGERGAQNEPATEKDIAEISAIALEGLKAGALGVSTSRTMMHLAIDGEPVPGTFATEKELLGLANAVRKAGHGIVESAPAGITGDDLLAPEKEMAWMKKVSLEAGVPITFLFAQNNVEPDAWRVMLAECEQANAAGARIYPQVFGRQTNLLFSFQGNNPFFRYPSYLSLIDLPQSERVARLSDPELRKRIISEIDPNDDAFTAFVQDGWNATYELGEPMDFEPHPDLCIASIAKREGSDPKAVAYDLMLQRNGCNFLFFSGINYTYGNHDCLREMIAHPLSVLGGSDGGAHCTYICDASVPTFMLTHWTRDRKRGERFPIEWVIKKQTQDPARVFGLVDRGVVAPGFKADINLINYDELQIHTPVMVNDLPSGAPRLMTTAAGYEATIVSGTVVQRKCKETGARPGRVIRGGKL